MGRIITILHSLYLSYSDSDDHFQYKINRALALGIMRTYLEKIKKVVKLSKLRDLSARAKIKTLYLKNTTPFTTIRIFSSTNHE